MLMSEPTEKETTAIWYLPVSPAQPPRQQPPRHSYLGQSRESGGLYAGVCPGKDRIEA